MTTNYATQPCVYWTPTFLILTWWLYDLQFLWRAMPDYYFGWIAVLLAGYLVWERWPSLPKADQPTAVWLCAGLTLIGMPFVLVAELYQQAIAHTPSASFVLSIGCTFFLAANILYLRGRATLRHFRLPWLFVGTAVPLPGILWNPIVLGLQRLIAWLTVESLNVMGIPAAQQVNVIRLPNCLVGIDEACSGIRSLQSCVMAALFIGAVTLKRLGARLVLVFAGVVLAVFGNYLRSMYLSTTAYRHGPEALTGVHDLAGWAILGFTTVGLAVIAWAIARVERC
ncbi:MAG: exosortase/archaeosortase family protein [Limisphaerales bacterium]